MSPSSERPQWTPTEPEGRSWFDAPVSPRGAQPPVPPAAQPPDPSVPPAAPAAQPPVPPSPVAGPRTPATGAWGTPGDQGDPNPAAWGTDVRRSADAAGNQDFGRPGAVPAAGDQDLGRPVAGPTAGVHGLGGPVAGPSAGSQELGRSAGDPDAAGSGTEAWAPMAGGFRSAAAPTPSDDRFARAETDRWTPQEWGATGDRWGQEPPVARWGAAEQAPAGNRPDDQAWAAAAAQPVAVGATRATLPADGKRHAVRHPVRLGLFVLVLFGLVAGSVAWMSMDKSVRLTVDGEARAVSTYASTVGGVLDDAGVTVGEHDTLAPAADAKVTEGSEIVLRRGRLVTLTVDGRPRQVWVTATTVQEALDQVGMRQSGLFVSANRSERLPLEGYQLTLRTPKAVTIVADGKRFRLTTTAPTVGEVMDEAGVRVDGDDRVSQLATAVVRNGMTVTVTRVATRTTTSTAEVEYKTVEKVDPKAAVGSKTVTTKGVTGLQQVTRVQTYVDGKLTSTRVAKITQVRAPVDEVVVVGPEPPEPPPTQPTQPAECADFPTTGGLNWCGLAKCESGLNPNAYNPAGPYYGLYQFDQGTWTSNGGSGSPSGKSVAEQTAIAWNLYQARGASPWPVCGRQL